MTTEKINISINGNNYQARENISILQALTENNYTLIKNVGCAGQGVCGSCKVLLKRKDEKTVNTALACETSIEDGMQVSFLDAKAMAHFHPYEKEAWQNSWDLLSTIHQIFPESLHCRHCGGCDKACPKGLEVQKGVEFAKNGDFLAATIFDECIMCNLCSMACPEFITPNHLGLFMRRANAAINLRPTDLLARLHQIETNQMTVDITRV